MHNSQAIPWEEALPYAFEAVLDSTLFVTLPQMLLQMQGVFAEYERALIHERTRRGQLFAARQGRVNWGNPPYGYTYIRKTPTTSQHLVINEAEAEIVRQIYRWCVEEHLSSYAIHRRLTAQGIPPRKSPRGQWAQSSVIEILRDSIYKKTT